jgi:hypothetical protein
LVGTVESWTTGLGDPAARIVPDRLARLLQLAGAAARAEQDAVPPGALDGLEHQLLEGVEDVRALVVEPAAERVDVGQARLLAEVEGDHLGDVGVDQLVVAHAVAHRVRDHDVARPRGVDQAADTEHPLGAELERVEELVVDPPVDHVDALVALRGAHVDEVVAAEQVAALDQLDAHLPGQQRVLEVGGVEDTGGQHDDGGSASFGAAAARRARSRCVP